MNKNEMKKLLKEKATQLIIVASCFVLSIVLIAINGGSFVNGLGILMLLGTIGYAIFVTNGIVKKYKAAAEEKAKEKKAQAEAEEKAKAEKAVEEFKATVDVDAEIDHILSMIKNNPSIKSFEQGVEKLIEKTNTTLSKGQLRSALLEVLLKRTLESKEPVQLDTPASTVLSKYFARNMHETLSDDYSKVALAEKRLNGASSSTEAQFFSEYANNYRLPFIKNLYGLAARAWNYVFCLQNGGVHTPIDDEFLMKLIETDSVIKSYCEANPFEAEEKKKEWLADIRNAVYTTVQSTEPKLDVKGDEKALDALCYMGYLALTKKESKDLGEIADDIYEVIKPYCEELVQKTN